MDFEVRLLDLNSNSTMYHFGGCLDKWLSLPDAQFKLQFKKQIISLSFSWYHYKDQVTVHRDIVIVQHIAWYMEGIP